MFDIYSRSFTNLHSSTNIDLTVSVSENNIKCASSLFEKTSANKFQGGNEKLERTGN